VFEVPDKPEAVDGPTVHVLPAGLSFTVPAGWTIFEAARDQGYSWPSICGGAADCTRCFLEVVEGLDRFSPMEEDERMALDRVRWRGSPRPAERLACRARVSGDVVVRRRSVRRREQHNVEEHR
jgi:2Fe-2S ferredoxin